MPADGKDSNRGSSSPARSLTQASDDAAALLDAFSHDVSTPLANIKLGAEVLVSAGGRLSQEQLVDIGSNVSSEADRLRRMIDTLIEWSRIELAAHPMNQQWLLAEDLVGAALRGLKPFLDDQEVVVTIEPDMAFVRGDDVLIETVLENLIDSAARCTPSGEAIEVVVRADDSGCTFEVIDGDHAEAPEGGLGWTLSRKIVEAHGGEIWTRKPNDASGAVFAFVLGYGGESPPHAPIDAPEGDDGID
jgi:two-component system sensor histidine kinase KdpD